MTATSRVTFYNYLGVDITSLSFNPVGDKLSATGYPYPIPVGTKSDEYEFEYDPTLNYEYRIQSAGNDVFVGNTCLDLSVNPHVVLAYSPYNPVGTSYLLPCDGMQYIPEINLVLDDSYRVLSKRSLMYLSSLDNPKIHVSAGYMESGDLDLSGYRKDSPLADDSLKQFSKDTLIQSTRPPVLPDDTPAPGIPDEPIIIITTDNGNEDDHTSMWGLLILLLLIILVIIAIAFIAGVAIIIRKK